MQKRTKKTIEITVADKHPDMSGVQGEEDDTEWH
jgi:hypothetical protein